MGNSNTNSNTNPAPAMQLTAEDLQRIISTAIAAAKEPNEYEKIELEEKKEELARKRAQIEQDQQTRRDTAQQQLQILNARKQMQRVCTHKHRDGHTHGVHIVDDIGGFVLCQKCQAVIRPGMAPKGYTGTVIFDTDLFNRLFQETASNGFWE